MRHKTGITEVPFVARPQRALEIRSECQFITRPDVIGRRQDFRDLGTQERERTGHCEPVRKLRQPDEVALETGDLCIGRIIREEQVGDAGIKDRRLQILNVDEEQSCVELECSVGKCRLGTQLEIGHVVSIQRIRHCKRSTRVRIATGSIEQTSAETFGNCAVPHLVAGRSPGSRDLEDRTVSRGLVRRADRIIRCKLSRNIGAEGLRIRRCPKIKERTIGTTVEIDFDVIPPGADCNRKLIRKVVTQFTENTELLIRPQNVVAENNIRWERARIGKITRRCVADQAGYRRIGQRVVWPESENATALPIIYPGCRKNRTRIGKVVNLPELHILVKSTSRQAQRFRLVRGDAELMRDRLEVVPAVDEQVRRLTGAIRITRRAETRIGDVVVADVIRQVLTNEKVIRVVDDLIRVAIGECAGVEQLQLTDGEGGGPCRVAKTVLDTVRAESLDGEVAHARVREEHTVRLEGLLRMLQIEAQLVAEVPAEAHPATGVGGVIEILFDQ